MSPPPSRTHVVIIPSYDTGADRLIATVREAAAAWSPLRVVIDGSTDGSGDALRAAVSDLSGVSVLGLPRNRGKGAALQAGLLAASARGFTHALTMDADGQHPAAAIAPFMARSAAEPRAMILGVPLFGPDAPSIRVRGRRISNRLVRAETLGGTIGDSLCGFRVYPIAPLLAVMAETRWMRRFDFDAEAVVRLAWRGVQAINLPVPVTYLTRDEGGVSHFRYVRDNILLTAMHGRLLAGAARRLPGLLRGRREPAGASPPPTKR